MIKQYCDQPGPERERPTLPLEAAMATDARGGNCGSGETSCLDLGQRLMAQGDYAGALICLERHHSGSSNPEVSEVSEVINGAISLAVCRLHLQQPTAALQVCNQVLAIDPRHPQALLFKGVALHRLGRYRAAYALYRQAIPLAKTPRWTLARLKGHVKGMVRRSKIGLRLLWWGADTTLES
ncbi:MAG: tetratricopeptide repeat protein [Cyanobacteria bacterium]|nr:tetratricopeptide repeat protein [Cyanobacteriota bacterium]